MKERLLSEDQINYINSNYFSQFYNTVNGRIGDPFKLVQKLGEHHGMIRVLLENNQDLRNAMLNLIATGIGGKFAWA